MNRQSDIKSGLLEGIKAAGMILPLSLAFGICSGFGWLSAFVTSLACCVLYLNFGAMPGIGGFAVMWAVGTQYGTMYAYISLLVCGILLLIFGKKSPHVNKLADSAGGAALMLGLALIITITQTNNYFGIGAFGSNVVNLLKSYRSLGFHPNWRGILYGTVTLVVMITWRRKFKKLSASLGAPLISLVGTLIMNLCLNPDSTHTAITEAGSPANVKEMFSLLPFIETQSFDIVYLLYALLGGCALSFISLYSCRNSQAALCGASAVPCALLGGFPLSFTKKEKHGKLCVITSFCVSAAITAVVFLVPAVRGILGRVPLASLAVIIIVTMWQSVDWHSLKTAFTSGVPSIIIFLLCLVCCIVLNTAQAVLICVLFALANAKNLKTG